MQKIIIGVFAHPDDEAFGVSPTLIKEVAEGAEVHLVTLTSGQHGANPDSHSDLGALRLNEWRRGGELIGVRSFHHLEYVDGTLCNECVHPIVDRLSKLVISLIEGSSDTPVEFMSFDFGGISGHLDHIVAARAAALCFYRLKETYSTRISRLRLRCLPHADMPTHNTDWLYMDAGKTESEIDEVIDATAYHDDIIKVIRAHHSQRSDGEAHIANYGSKLGMNYFIVKT